MREEGVTKVAWIRSLEDVQVHSRQNTGMQTEGAWTEVTVGTLDPKSSVWHAHILLGHTDRHTSQASL